ncbi:MAG: YceI family protein [Betaproteobacteria bacterium]|nr:YceI family protein [Betaproteobacteria bacterium]
MKRLLAAAAVAALVLPATAQAAEYNRVLADRSQIGFVSKQMGVPVEGRFGRFAAQVSFDPARPDAGRAQIEVDLASIDTGSQEADDEVKSKNWFNVKAFPTARFVSSGLRALGEGRYEIAGRMTLKGRTRDLRLPVTLRQDGSGVRFEGVFQLKRLEWGIGEGPWADVDTVADEVQVRFRIALAAGAA